MRRKEFSTGCIALRLNLHRVKMYKSHLTAWGLRKYNRLCEARAILRKKRTLEAHGFTSIFIVRGQLANLEDIQRSCRRAREEPSCSEFDEDKSLPEGVECVVVPAQIATIATPQRLRSLEKFLHNAAIYVDNCFDHGLWRSTSDDEDLTHSFQVNGNTIKLCFDNLGHAASSVDKRQFQLGGAYLQSALEEFPTVLLTDHQDVVPTLLVQLQRIQQKGLNVLLRFIIQNLSGLVMQTLPPSHPHQTFFLALRDLATESIQCIYEVYMAQRRSLYAQNLGVHHFRVIRTDYLPSKGNGLASKSWSDVQAAIACADAQYGAQSRRAFQILRSYCYRVYGAGRWSEAAALFQELVLRAERAGNYNTRVSAQFRLGKIRQQQGKSAEAKVYWLAVLKLAKADLDIFKYWGLEVLESLAAVCRDQNEKKEAEQYDAELVGYHHTVLNLDEDRHRVDSIQASSPRENAVVSSGLCLASPREQRVALRDDTLSMRGTQSFSERLSHTHGWDKCASSHNGDVIVAPPGPTSWPLPLLPTFCPYQMNSLLTTAIPTDDW